MLRAVAIVVIVSHACGPDLAGPGTAHVLMALAGYNFARFQLGGDRLPRLRRQLVSVARIVVPTVVFIGAVMLLTDKFHYTPLNLVLLNTMIGPAGWTDAWHFWFVEVLVYVLLGMTALLAIPWVHRTERRFPLAFPVALIGAGLLARYGLLGFDILHTRPVLWLFALGWAFARARTVPQRLALSAIAAVALPGYFGDPLAGGHHPRRNPPARLGAGTSAARHPPSCGGRAGQRFAVCLPHPLGGFPDLKDNHPVLAVALSLAVGVAYWAVWVHLMGRVKRY